MVFHSNKIKEIPISEEELQQLDKIRAETPAGLTAQDQPLANLTAVLQTCAYVDNNDILNHVAVHDLIKKQIASQKAHASLMVSRLNQFFTDEYIKKSEVTDYLTARKQLMITLQNNSPATAFVESILYGSFISFMTGKGIGYFAVAFPVSMGLYLSVFVPLILRDLSRHRNMEDLFFKGLGTALSLPVAVAFFVAAAPVVLVVGFFAYLAKKIFSWHTQHKIEQLDQKYKTNPTAQKMKKMMDYLIAPPKSVKVLEKDGQHCGSSSERRSILHT